MKGILPKLTSVTIFSIAMAFLETATVIYLRELLYPGGFHFPLETIPGHLVLTEILREFATLVMLLGAGALAGKTFSQRFAWFIYAFAIWDIFYYVFLKILINWPESFMTWDILFLIPTTWTGPVISPVIVSLTMIVFALVILYFSSKELDTRLKTSEWILLISGSLILVFAFTLDYSRYILKYFSFKELWYQPDLQEIQSIATSYIPVKFTWWIFISGELIICLAIYFYFRRGKKYL
jgi:hypothetical protein